MKYLKMTAVIALVTATIFANAAEGVKVPPRSERMKWFTEARFGMFIHWGLYSEAARHEWLMSRAGIPVDEYERKYFKHFEPDLYNPEKWVAAAAAAGMKYIVITTKHHEGFCLWDSKYTDYKATNTLAQRDLLRPFVDACHRHGIRVGFYYSLIDWHHPMYVIDNCNGPYYRLPEAERAKMNVGRDQKIYNQYVRNQVKELLSGYGPVDIMWFDFSFPAKNGDRMDFTKGKGREAWESERLWEMVKGINPNIIIDDRMDLPEAADIKTPEQFQPKQALVDENGEPIAWEACQTFSGSWGYYRDEQTWRTSGELIRTLIDCVSKNGNLLLNVGPTARGEFDSRAMERLEAIGKWMKNHSVAIYGCGPAPKDIKIPQGCSLTYNKKTNRLYVHLLSWPYSAVYLENLADRIEYARFLSDHSEIEFSLEPWQLEKAQVPENTAILRMPNTPPVGVEVPVIEIFLKPATSAK